MSGLENDGKLVLLSETDGIFEIRDRLRRAINDLQTGCNGGFARLHLVAHFVHDVRRGSHKSDSIPDALFGKVATLAYSFSLTTYKSS